MTAKFSHCGKGDHYVIKCDDFQGPLTSNSKILKALLSSKELFRSWKNGHSFQKLKKNYQGVATLSSLNE